MQRSPEWNQEDFETLRKKCAEIKAQERIEVAKTIRQVEQRERERQQNDRNYNQKQHQ